MSSSGKTSEQISGGNVGAAITGFNGASADYIKTLQGITANPSTGRLSTHTGLQPFVSLNAVGGTIIGASLDCVSVHSNVLMAVTLGFTTAPTSISTQLQGSLDGNNWYSIGAAITSVAAGTTVVNMNIPARYFRAATTVAGGAGIAVTALIGVSA